MSKKNNHNSIVFLTTLSVYLGLVLVGGTAPVLAHSALTRDFDIKNEIVFEDDLDKNPNDKDLAENSEILKNFKIADAITNFLDDLKKFESIGKFNFKEDFKFSHELSIEDDFRTTSTDIENRWLLTAVEQLIEIPTISDDARTCSGNICKKTEIKVEANSNEFLLSFTFIKANSETAKLCAEAINKVFVFQKLESKNNLKVSIYENIKAKSENNQVFIVTRLPRGSIDALIAEKDAQ